MQLRLSRHYSGSGTNKSIRYVCVMAYTQQHMFQLGECSGVLKRSRDHSGVTGVYVNSDGASDPTGKLLLSIKACVLKG